MCLDFFNILLGALFWPAAGREHQPNELKRRPRRRLERATQVRGNGIFSFAKDQSDQDKAAAAAVPQKAESDDDDDGAGIKRAKEEGKRWASRGEDELTLLVGEKWEKKKEEEKKLAKKREKRHYASNILENFKTIEILASKPKGTGATLAHKASQQAGVKLVLDDDPSGKANGDINNENKNNNNNNNTELRHNNDNNNKRINNTNLASHQASKSRPLTEAGGSGSGSSMETLAGPGEESERAKDAEGDGAPSFRIRTADRRHLDFDGLFELGEAGALQRSHWSGPFHFIQAADCQFGMIDSYVHHRTEPGWSEEIELCERLVRACNQMRPRPLFMIICGDLVDSLPASQIGRKQVADFKRIFARLDSAIPLVCVCGNHDVGDQPTPQTVADYRQTFGDDYFYFTKNDTLFIVINSQFYQNRDHVQAEARAQDLWLERLLSKCRLFKYTIVFEHIPWFLERPEEDDDYFNIRKEVRLIWLQKFKAAGVTKIMCGHYHRNAGGWFEGMELVVTSAIGAQCGSDQSGVRIVRVLEDRIEHQYYAMQDIPLNVELNSSSSSLLTNCQEGAPELPTPPQPPPPAGPI